MQRRFSNPDMPTDDFCRRVIDNGFEGAKGEQTFSIYICRLSEEHNVTFNINIRLSMWLKCWRRALYWKTIMLLRKKKEEEKKHTHRKPTLWLFKVSHHECVRIELLLWMVYRVVFHAKRQSNVMHALSVDPCPRCWRETSKHSVNCRGMQSRFTRKIWVLLLLHIHTTFLSCITHVDEQQM